MFIMVVPLVNPRKKLLAQFHSLLEKLVINMNLLQILYYLVMGTFVISVGKLFSNVQILAVKFVSD